MRAKDFNTIYLPHIGKDTPLGIISKIMTAPLDQLSEQEKQFRRQRERQLNKGKDLKSADEFNSFARRAFGGKGNKK